jgi:hypothetical protein
LTFHSFINIPQLDNLPFCFRLEGFFYHDKYIGKEPNKKIRKRMAKEQRIDENVSTTDEDEER